MPTLSWTLRALAAPRARADAAVVRESRRALVVVLGVALAAVMAAAAQI